MSLMFRKRRAGFFCKEACEREFSNKQKTLQQQERQRQFFEWLFKPPSRA